MAVAPSLATDELAPTTIGLLNGVCVLGGSLLPFLAGALADRAGMWTLPPFALALAGAQVIIWWRTVRHLATPVSELETA